MAAAAGALALATQVADSALAAEPRTSFVLLHESDTLAVEATERTNGRLAGTLLFRPMSTRVDYVATLDDAGAVTRFTCDFRGAGDAPEVAPRQSVSAEFRRDSVIAEVTPGGTQRFASKPGACPFVNPSMALVLLAAQRVAPAQGASAHAPLFLMSGGATIDAVVSRPARDSLVIAFGAVSFRFALGADGSPVSGVVPEQGLTIRIAGELPAGLLSLPKPDYGAPPGAPYVAEEVRVPTRGGFTLAGTLTRPRDASGRVACVVTITGSGPEDRDEAIAIVSGYRPFRQIADTLGRRGIAVLRLDDRGVGGSGGRFAGATSRDFAGDVEDALAWLRARPDVDGARLALLGHSEGGLIAPLVATEDPRLRAIVLLAGPAWKGRRILAYQNAYAIDRAGLKGAARDSAVRAAAAQVDSLGAHDAWMAQFLTHDPIRVAGAVRAPALLMQGATDRQVTAEQAGELAEALRNGGDKDVTVHVLADTDHLFLRDPSGDPAGYMRLAEHAIRPEILGTIADWLAQRLR